jgi:hypothetical protein
MAYRPDVRRYRNLRYGDAGGGQLLDVYAADLNRSARRF